MYVSMSVCAYVHMSVCRYVGTRVHSYVNMHACCVCVCGFISQSKIVGIDNVPICVKKNLLFFVCLSPGSYLMCVCDPPVRAFVSWLYMYLYSSLTDTECHRCKPNICLVLAKNKRIGALFQVCRCRINLK